MANAFVNTQDAKQQTGNIYLAKLLQGIGPFPNVNNRKHPPLGTEAGGKLAGIGRHTHREPKKKKKTARTACKNTKQANNQKIPGISLDP